jgi:hypothetical protein
VVATALSVWVTLLRVVSGTAPFDRLDTTYPTVVGLYYAGALAGGLVIGLAWPLRRWLFGSALLGVLGMLPLYLGVAYIESAPSQWLTEESLTVAVLLAILVGAPVGTLVWFRDHPIRPPWIGALSSPRPKTVVLVWIMALLLSGGSCVYLPRRIENWPPPLVILVFLVVFVVPLAMALLLTLRIARGSRR